MVRVVEVAPAKTCKCSNCKATLEYGFADIQSKYNHCVHFGGETNYWINCPQCNEKTYVSKWS